MIFLPYNINTIPYKLKILVGQPSIFVGVYSQGTVHELSNTPSNGKIYLQTWGRPKARDWLATESNHQRIRQGKKCSANGARADTSFTSWIATNCKMAGIALMLGWEIRDERSIPLKDNQTAMLKTENVLTASNYVHYCTKCKPHVFLECVQCQIRREARRRYAKQSLHYRMYSGESAGSSYLLAALAAKKKMYSTSYEQV